MASLLHRITGALRRLFRREPPHDPYAYVMARRKPRPGGRSASAVLDEPGD